ncbi:N-acetyltransferase [Jiangella ureilytica]|uniref:N-acetyltransferase n=1 Tax=Jiangella ureilytica TaxID=2530374 RepID=A0A4R4RV35_9ACTN|nr:GNAT family N-acetyltransferase [Jiangella ureilytica]TDC53544.1 N-acetyltransferase [Jiangella ureilytica]
MSDESAPAAGDIVVRDNPEARSYDALVGDTLVAITAYEAEGTRRVLTHTAVEPEYRGRGVGGRLVRGVLDDLRARGLTATVFCEYVAGYIESHPEYADVVDPDQPGRVQPGA